MPKQTMTEDRGMHLSTCTDGERTRRRAHETRAPDAVGGCQFVAIIGVVVVAVVIAVANERLPPVRRCHRRMSWLSTSNATNRPSNVRIRTGT